jgi:hypothetical protein
MGYGCIIESNLMQPQSSIETRRLYDKIENYGIYI